MFIEKETADAFVDECVARKIAQLNEPDRDKAMIHGAIFMLDCLEEYREREGF